MSDIDIAFDKIGPSLEATPASTILPGAPDLLTRTGAPGQPVATPATLQTTPAAAPTSALGKFADFILPSSPEVRGRLLGGAAEGALKGLLSGSDSEAILQAGRERTAAQQEELAAIRASHSGATRGLLTPGPQRAAPAGAVSPVERFGASQIGRWFYNPRTRRIEFESDAPAAATA